MTDIIKSMSGGGKILIGMVHLLPLPGTLRYRNNMDEVERQAIGDAVAIETAGFDAIMIENMGDAPGGEHLEPHQLAAMAAIGMLIRKKVSVPIGVSASFTDAKSALAIAAAINAQFIRCPVFVDTVITSYGVIGPHAKEAVLYRKFLGMDSVKILADVQVKHSQMLAETRSIQDSAATAEKYGADAIIVTGTGTGVQASSEQLVSVRNTVKIPLVIGSGFRADNAAEQFKIADGAIVGSSLKVGGVIKEPVSEELARKLVRAAKS